MSGSHLIEGIWCG